MIPLSPFHFHSNVFLQFYNIQNITSDNYRIQLFSLYLHNFTNKPINSIHISQKITIHMFTERASRVQEIMNQMAIYNTAHKATKSSASYNPHKKIQLYKELIPIDKEEVKDRMRVKQKRSWRVSGLSLGEFSPAGFIKGKVLDNWQISRVDMSNRSYTTPKDFKGIKIRSHLTQFPKPSAETLSNNSKLYFKKCLEDYQNKQSQTLEIAKTYDTKLGSFRQSLKKQFRGTNTIQSNAFGQTMKSSFRAKTFGSNGF